jgi:hypothetical protein
MDRPGLPKEMLDIKMLKRYGIMLGHCEHKEEIGMLYRQLKNTKVTHDLFDHVKGKNKSKGVILSCCLEQSDSDDSEREYERRMEKLKFSDLELERPPEEIDEREFFD